MSVHGLIAKSLEQQLRRLSLGNCVGSLIQKAVLLDTALVVTMFLSLLGALTAALVAWTLFQIGAVRPREV